MGVIYILSIVFFVITVIVPIKSKHLIYVISDTHIGNPESTQHHQAELKRFLMKLAEEETLVKALVIAGDFLEGWMYPIDQEIPNFSTMIKDAKLDGTPLVDLLKAIILNDVEIHVLRGNHDQDLQSADFYSNGLYYVRVDDYYMQYGVEVRHGHLYDMFNHHHGFTHVVPFGYLYGRLRASSATNVNHNIFPRGTIHLALQNEIVALAMLVGAYEDLPFDQALERARILYPQKDTTWEAEFPGNIVGGCFYPQYDHQDIPVWRMIEKLISVFEREWDEDDPYSGYISCLEKGLFAGFSSCWNGWNTLTNRMYVGLEKVGFRHFLWSDYAYKMDLVVLGHTHQTKDYLKYIHSKHHRMIYVNDGYWIGDKMTYAKINIDLERGRADHVDVCEFTPDNDCVVLDSADVSDAKQRRTVDFEVEEKENERRHFVPCTIPDGWTCATEFYNDGRICDCNCGIRDPDCNNPDLPTNCYKSSVHTTPVLNTTCNVDNHVCEWIRDPLPTEWTCNETDWMDGSRICRCNCGVFDPHCQISFRVEGCDHDENTEHAICLENPDGTPKCVVVPKNKKVESQTPFGWVCPKKWYNSLDGCDCHCGVHDPDCGEWYGKDVCHCDTFVHEGTDAYFSGDNRVKKTSSSVTVWMVLFLCCFFCLFCVSFVVLVLCCCVEIRKARKSREEARRIKVSDGDEYIGLGNDDDDGDEVGVGEISSEISGLSDSEGERRKKERKKSKKVKQKMNEEEEEEVKGGTEVMIEVKEGKKKKKKKKMKDGVVKKVEEKRILLIGEKKEEKKSGSMEFDDIDLEDFDDVEDDKDGKKKEEKDEK